ncbi:testis-specific serine kinase substrate [Latimeria chalumnae]
MHWRLQLKRSSATTNVSALNLAAELSQEEDEPSENVTTGSSMEGSCTSLEQTGHLCPGTPTEMEQQEPDEEILKSGLVIKAKDSITTMKTRADDFTQHIKRLQWKCDSVKEYLELSPQEGSELEEHCSRLETSCRVVEDTVDEVEKKAAELQQNSEALEHQLKLIYGHLKSEQKTKTTWEELKEVLLESTVEQSSHPPTCDTTGTLDQLETSAPIQQATADILTSVDNLKRTLSSGMNRLNEFQRLEEENVSRPPSPLNQLEDIRKSLVHLSGMYDKEKMKQKEMLGMLTHFNFRFEEFVREWERTQKQQLKIEQAVRELRSNTEDIVFIAKKTHSAFTQLKSELDTLKGMKPLVEKVSRQLLAFRGPEKLEKLPSSCVCRSNHSYVNNDTLNQLLGLAVTSLRGDVHCHVCPGTSSEMQQAEDSNSSVMTPAPLAS